MKGANAVSLLEVNSNNRKKMDRLYEQPIALILPILIALAARLLGIVSRPIWYDEAFAILFSEKGPAAMVRGTLAVSGGAAADVHPLGYYTLLWLWMRLFGESLIAVRLLSILAGLGVVAIAILLGRELFRPATAVAAGALVALAPFQVHYSQEIRMYSWLALWLLLATYCYWRGSRSRSWLWWLGFSVFSALAQYMQNLAAFYLVALALWPVFRREWRLLVRVGVAGLLAVLLYLPWLVHLPAQFARVDQSYWVSRPEAYRLLTLLLFFVTNLPLPASELAAGLMITMLLIAIALVQTVRAIRLREMEAEGGVWLLYLSFFPPVLLFLFSQWKPVYLERALLPSGAVFCIWLAWALFQAKTPRALSIFAACLIVIGFAMGLYVHVTDRGGIYGPFQAVMQNLDSRRVPGDVIVHSTKLSMLPSVYFDRHLPQTYLADHPGSPMDTLAPATQQALGLPAQPDLQTAVAGAERVWYIIFDESVKEYADAGYTEPPDIAWLRAHYSSMQEQTWETLQVYLFSNEH